MQSITSGSAYMKGRGRPKVKGIQGLRSRTQLARFNQSITLDDEDQHWRCAANIQDTCALARGGLPLLRLRMTACWKKQLVSTFCVLGQHLPCAAAADDLRAAEPAEAADWSEGIVTLISDFSL